jgi:predicted DNA-binding transcriptional regulator AlpA
MAETGKDRGEELLTLSEVSNRTGISMPTLQRYKKNYQDRIPSEGRGRKQRYPVESLSVFKKIKEENIAKRGRPRKKKDDGGDGRRRRRGRRGRPASRRASRSVATEGRKGLLTLTEVGKRTGISYPTLVRYVKDHGDRIPYEGEGRQKRYHPEAVKVFKEIRSESPRGRRKGGVKKTGGRRAAASASAGDGSIARRLQALERSQEKLATEIRDLVKHLKKPVTATFQRK